MEGKTGMSISVKGHRTIFDEILSGNLLEEDKSLERLWQEGQIVVGGGSETAALGFVFPRGLVTLTLIWVSSALCHRLSSFI